MDFMDLKAKQMCDRYCNKIVNREFDEHDIYGFYIFIRNYLEKFQGDYTWIQEWADLVAHRNRDQGRVLKSMKNAMKNQYEIVKRTKTIKGYQGMKEGTLEREFCNLFRELGYKLSNEIQKEIVLCTFSIANFTCYQLDESIQKVGIVRLWQIEDGLALLTSAGGKGDVYICLSTLTGNYIHTNFSFGCLKEPVEVVRKNGKLVVLCDGKEI